MINKKIFLSSMSILSALVLMGGAAFALFTSAASNNGNTFGAGDLVLRINGLPGSTSSPVFTVANAAPGNVYEQAIDLNNNGSVNAGSVKVTGIAVGGSAALAAQLNLQLALDNNNNNIFDGGDTVLGSAALTDPSWTNFVLPSVTLPSGVTKDIVGTLTFSSSADNSLQGASTNFNISFEASQ